jgi:hypothetical protein
MTTDNVWQLLLRRGPASDLPGTPTAPGQPPTTGLAEGELGMTTDTGRLFLGVNPQQGMPNYNRSAFPYNNVEVLTENSPLTTLFGVAFSDNQLAFYQSLPLQETASFVSLTMTSLADGQPTEVRLDNPFGANVSLFYVIVSSSGQPMRQGTLNVLWNPGFSVPPLCTDNAITLSADYNEFQWQAIELGGIGREYIALQYINQTSDTPTVFFRMDRPSGVFVNGGGTAGLTPANPGGITLTSDGYIPWTFMEPELQNMPLAFMIPGKPLVTPAQAVYNIVVPEAIAFAKDFAGPAGESFGSYTYCATTPTNAATFQVNVISGGTTTNVGSITLHSESHTAATLTTISTSGFSMQAGDVLQLLAPSPQDATLADIGITLLGQKT